MTIKDNPEYERAERLLRDVELGVGLPEEILLHEACFTWGCLEYYASIATEEMEQELEERMKLLGYTFHSEEQIETARAAIDALKAKPTEEGSRILIMAALTEMSLGLATMQEALGHLMEMLQSPEDLKFPWEKPITPKEK